MQQLDAFLFIDYHRKCAIDNVTFVLTVASLSFSLSATDSIISTNHSKQSLIYITTFTFLTQTETCNNTQANKNNGNPFHACSGIQVKRVVVLFKMPFYFI